MPHRDLEFSVYRPMEVRVFRVRLRRPEFSEDPSQFRSFPYTGWAMASKQTRRSISVSGDLYDRLKAWCEQRNVSMSGVVEEELRKRLGMEARPEAQTRPFVAPVRKTEPPVVLTTKTLESEAKWNPATPDRVEKIREVVEAKKTATPLAAIDAASKIFTF